MFCVESISCAVSCVCMCLVSVKSRRSTVLSLTVSAKGHPVRHAAAPLRQIQHGRRQFIRLESVRLQPAVDSRSAVTVQPDVWDWWRLAAQFTGSDVGWDAGRWQSTEINIGQDSARTANSWWWTSRTGSAVVVLVAISCRSFTSSDTVHAIQCLVTVVGSRKGFWPVKVLLQQFTKICFFLVPHFCFHISQTNTGLCLLTCWVLVLCEYSKFRIESNSYFSVQLDSKRAQLFKIFEYLPSPISYLFNGMMPIFYLSNLILLI